MAGNFCTRCGAPRRGEGGFCTSCGAAFPGVTEVPVSMPAQSPPPPAQPGPGFPQPSAPPRKKSVVPAVLGIGCGAVLLLAGLAFVGVLLFSGDGTSGGGSEFIRYDLSGDQQRVVQEFGLPRTFTIVYGEDVEGAVEGGDLDTHRVEFWDYYEMGTRFVFRDGKVVATREIEPLGPDFDYPAISPAQFVSGMSVADVNETMGFEPGASAQVDEGVAEGMEVLVWDGLLSCTFVNGGLVAAETAPVTGEVAQ